MRSVARFSWDLVTADGMPIIGSVDFAELASDCRLLRTGVAGI